MIRALPVLCLFALIGCESVGIGLGGSERVHLEVEGRAQGRSLSCESRSAVDLLGFYGIRVTEETFLASLPRSDNPDLGFVGDVNGPGEQLPPAGYGVHVDPVARAIRQYGLIVDAHRGKDLAWLRSELRAGRPVLVWATGQLDAPAGVRMRGADGRDFTAVRGEHTFIVVGAGPGELVLLDPATGREKRVFDQQFDASWATLGRTAISARPS